MRVAIVFDPTAPLRTLRLLAGFSQTQAAALLGITQGAVSDGERRGAHVELATVQRYADAFGLQLRFDVRTVRRA